MDLGLAGRVAVAAAASKELGRASAGALAAGGVKVVLNARDRDALRGRRRAGPHCGEREHAGLGPARPRSGSAHARAAVGARGVHRLGPGRQPVRDLALSNVARTGLWAWAKTAAQDLAEQGITVNIAAPGHMPPTASSSVAGPAAPVSPPTSARSSHSCARSRRTSSTVSRSASTAAPSPASWNRGGPVRAVRRPHLESGASPQAPCSFSSRSRQVPHRSYPRPAARRLTRSSR
jgi:NAD(P)-dependent dehydrogenase (short-subunit alcohol dehydrogenase family)